MLVPDIRKDRQYINGEINRNLRRWKNPHTATIKEEDLGVSVTTFMPTSQKARRDALVIQLAGLMLLLSVYLFSSPMETGFPSV